MKRYSFALITPLGDLARRRQRARSLLNCTLPFGPTVSREVWDVQWRFANLRPPRRLACDSSVLWGSSER